MSDNTAGWLDIMTGQFIPNPNYRPKPKAQPKAQPKRKQRPQPQPRFGPEPKKPLVLELRGIFGDDVNFCDCRPVTRREWTTLKERLLRSGGKLGKRQVTSARVFADAAFNEGKGTPSEHLTF